MLRDMLRGTLVVIALGFALSAPALCLAGLLEHLCSECSDTACGHEENCSGDPCVQSQACPVSSSRDAHSATQAAMGELALTSRSLYEPFPAETLRLDRSRRHPAFHGFRQKSQPLLL